MALARTSKLEAVNKALQMMGESPVNSLQGLLGLGNLAETTINSVSRKLQTEGWSFNTDYEADLTRDSTTNEISVGTSTTRVYVDPYATTQATNWFVCGYKGSSAYDAGLFYCPYVPLQMVRAVGENSFQPKIGFKTRYGMVSNPFSTGTAASSDGSLTYNTNVYYRRCLVTNLM